MKKIYFLILIFFNLIFPFVSSASQVISPNGGEIIAPCQSYKVSMYNDRLIDEKGYLYYSVNNGSTWTKVFPQINLKRRSNNDFDWFPTNLSSDSCLIKIENIYGLLIAQSDSVFSVSPYPGYVKITSPNGGEKWDVSSTQQVTWDYISDSANVSLSYRFLTSSSWTSIGDVPNTGSYTWEVPNTIGDQYSFKIYESACAQDESDSLFEVQATPYVHMRLPKGGELFFGAHKNYIAWYKGLLSGDSLNISYSVDSGQTWVLISKVASSSTYYNWDTPNGLDETNCFIKISEDGDPNKFDISGKVTLKSSTVEIEALTSNDTLYSCNTTTLKLSKNCPNIGFVDLSYSLDNGVSWDFVQENFSPFPSYLTTPTSKTIYWDVPYAESNQVLFKVESRNAPSIKYTTDTPGTITNSHNIDINLLNLSGGEVVKTGELFTVKFSTTYPSQGLTWSNENYSIYHSVDGGKTWGSDNKVYSIAGDSINWIVPNLPSDSCLIIVKSTSTDCSADTSSSFFKIEKEGNITLEYPSVGGLDLFANSIETIQWRSTNISSGLVDIEFSSDNGLSWSAVAIGQPNTGTYSWSVTGVISTNCLIKIFETGNNSVYDQSDSVFSVQASSFEFINPKIGDVFTGCTNISCEWTEIGTTVSKIYFSPDSGSTWTKINGTIANNSFEGKLPNSSSNNCFLMITNSDSTLTKISDVFSVTKPLVITSPNGGELIDINSSFEVKWEIDSNTTLGNFTINRSFDGGATWSYMNGSNAGNNTFNWLLYNDTSSRTIISIASRTNTCITDTSDAYFSVLPIHSISFSSIDSVYFAKDYVFLSAKTKNIPNTDVVMELSIDSGLTWGLVEAVFPTTGNLKGWNVPDTSSEKCLIRLSEIGNPSVYVVSKTFSIVKKKYICNSFAQGEVVQGCTPKRVSWKAIGYSASASLHYSIDSGATWKVSKKATGYSSEDTAMYWLLPQVDASNCMLKITSTQNSSDYTILDSKINLTITPMNLNLVSPSEWSSSNWKSGEYQSIKWNKSVNISTVHISLYNYYNDAYINSYSTSNDSIYSIFIAPNGPNALKLVIGDNNGCVSSETHSPIYVDNSSFIKPSYPRSNSEVYKKSNLTIYFQKGNLPQFSEDKVLVYYSVDSINWSFIGGTLGSSMLWNVPDLNADSCLLKFISQDAYDTVVAYSNYFKLLDQYIEVVSPSGGEQFFGCGSHRITWSKHTANNIDSINIYYSINSGNSWNPIVLNKEVKSYNWSIPSINSNNCLIKIENAADLSIFGISKTSFSISTKTNSTITLTSHQNGVPVYSTFKDTVRWVSSSDVTNVHIERSLNGGVTWAEIATNQVNNGEFAYTIPNYEASNALIRVKDANGCAQSTSASYNIVGVPNIQIYSPRYYGYLVDEPIPIEYGAFFLNSDSVKVEYSDNGGLDWSLIQKNGIKNNRGYLYWVPDYWYINDLLIKITDLVDTNVYAISQPFRIVQPYFYFHQPIGSQVYSACSEMNISWSSEGYYLNTGVLEFSSDTGKSWSRIDSIYVNYQYYYTWTLPAINSSTCKIRFKSWGGYQFESEMFTVTNQSAALKITSPTNGVQLKAGTTVPITWTSSTNVSKVSLAYSIDKNGNGLKYIQTNYANTGTYDWVIDSAFAASDIFIRVSDDKGCALDYTDTSFFVESTSYIKLNTLNSGEILTSGASYYLSWITSSLSSTQQLVDLSYSIDGGSTWIDIEKNVDLKTNSWLKYEWKAPNVNSTLCLFKVTDSGNNSFFDISDTFFTINSVQKPIVISPAENDLLIAGTTHTILWDKNSFDTDVTISYSENGGLTWIAIIVNENIDTSAYVAYNDGVYQWTVPSLVSNDVLIKVASKIGSGKSYNSKKFSIAKTVSVEFVQSDNGFYSLFPNPNNGLFTIQNEHEADIDLLEVYSILGERVYMESNIGFISEIKIQMSDVSPGIYLLKLTRNGGSDYIKMIVK